MNNRKSMNYHCSTPFSQRNYWFTTPTTQINLNINENFNTFSNNINPNKLNQDDPKKDNLKSKIPIAAIKKERGCIENEPENPSEILIKKSNKKIQTNYDAYKHYSTSSFRWGNKNSLTSHTSPIKTCESKVLYQTRKSEFDVKDDLRTIKNNISWLSEKIRNMDNLLDINKKKYIVKSAIYKTKISKKPLKGKRKKMPSVNIEAVKNCSIWNDFKQVEQDYGDNKERLNMHKNRDTRNKSQNVFYSNYTNNAVNKPNIYYKPQLDRSSFSFNMKFKENQDKKWSPKKGKFSAIDMKTNETMTSINLSDIADDIYETITTERLRNGKSKQKQENKIIQAIKQFEIQSTPRLVSQYMNVKKNWTIEKGINELEIKQTDIKNTKMDGKQEPRAMPAIIKEKEFENDNANSEAEDEADADDEDEDANILINQIRNRVESLNDNKYLQKNKVNFSENDTVYINFTEDTEVTKMEVVKTGEILNTKPKNMKLYMDILRSVSKPNAIIKKYETEDIKLNPDYIPFESRDDDEFWTESEPERAPEVEENGNNAIYNIRQMMNSDEESEVDEHIEDEPTDKQKNSRRFSC